MADHMHVLEITYLSEEYPFGTNFSLTSMFILNNDFKHMVKGSNEKILIEWMGLKVSDDQSSVKIYSTSKYDCKVIQEVVTNMISDFCSRHHCNVSWKMMC